MGDGVEGDAALRLAVGSPNLSAAQAWADSWTEMAKRTTANWTTMRNISFIIMQNSTKNGFRQ